MNDKTATMTTQRPTSSRPADPRHVPRFSCSTRLVLRLFKMIDPSFCLLPHVTSQVASCITPGVLAIQPLSLPPVGLEWMDVRVLRA